MRIKTLFVMVCFLLAAAYTCYAQQGFVSRFDAFGGYSFFDSPKLSLFENGFNSEFGVNVRTWVALGGDFSIFSGSSTLTQNELSGRVQQMIPPGAFLTSPFNSTTYTYSAGPQFNIRKLKSVTFFIRPALGALHETVQLRPKDPISAELILALIGPSMKKSDTVVFYGFGGGVDFNLSQHLGLRTTADFVHYDVFSNLLNGGRNSVRFSIGPTFRFGKNIVVK